MLPPKSNMDRGEREEFNKSNMNINSNNNNNNNNINNNKDQLEQEYERQTYKIPSKMSSKLPGKGVVPISIAKLTSSDAEPEFNSTKKKYICKICQQSFTRKHNMVSHELIHSSLKPFNCSVCDLRFRRIHDLKRHQKLHTGEKPFRCDKCNRGFARPDALTRHQNSSNACSGVHPGNELRSIVFGELPVQILEGGIDGSDSSSAHSTSSLVAATRSETPSSKIEIVKDKGKSSTLVTDQTRQGSDSVGSGGSTSDTSVNSGGNIADTINRENYDLNRWKAFKYSQLLLTSSPYPSDNQNPNQITNSNQELYVNSQKHHPKQRPNQIVQQQQQQQQQQQHQQSQYSNMHPNDSHDYQTTTTTTTTTTTSNRNQRNQDGDRDELRYKRQRKHLFEQEQLYQIHKRQQHDLREEQYQQRQQLQHLQQQHDQEEQQYQQNQYQQRVHRQESQGNLHKDSAESHDFDDYQKHNYNPANQINSFLSRIHPPPEHSSGGKDYVTMERYQELVTYTNTLQESLGKMNSRLTQLEGQSDGKKESK